jgi:hypothetical protein
MNRISPHLTRCAARGAILGLLAATGIAGAAQAAPSPVSGVKASIGQGMTKYDGKPKYRARGSVSFSSSASTVECRDSLSLERRVKNVAHGKVSFNWILIRGGERERTCSASSARSSLTFLNDPAPYRRLLGKSKLRLRYSVKITADGATAYRKTIVKPVTSQLLSHSFRVA